MPKIGTRYIPVPAGTGKSVEATLHYFDQDKYEKIFFVELPEDYREEVSGKIEQKHIRQRKYLGKSGKTEDEAIQNATEYIKWFVDAQVTRSRVILIKTTNSRDGRVNGEDEATTHVELKFSFFNAYYVEAGGKRTYYKDRAYHFERYSHGGSGEIYEHEMRRLQVIPYSDASLKRCEELVEAFHKLNDRVQDLFRTPEAALAALNNSSIKLIG